ncbi:MAG: SOS response-associated peptidase [Candidatus Hermodarchaeia archaeon]|jgi:putative SOS response-associated peptidase YedK
MCYHYTVPDIDLLKTRFDVSISEIEVFDRVYHVSGFVKPQLPVITNDAPNSIQMLSWGLIPHWVRDLTTATKLQSRLLNARSETIHEKPAFRSLITSKRCMVLADGFFEWRHYGGRAYPYYIQLSTGEPFAFAGLWDNWTNPETGALLKTYTIITTWANPLLEQVHNKRKRMPVILHKADERPWLTLDLGQDAIDSLLVPFEAHKMVAHPVSRIITTKGAKKNVPEAIKPKEYPELPTIKF